MDKNNCNEEKTYEKDRTVGLREKVLTLYGKGTAVRKIASKLRTNVLVVCDIVNRDNIEHGSVPGYVQEKYIDMIKPLVSHGTYDGKLKPIKEQLPSECTYETISYVVSLMKETRKKEREEFKAGIEDMIKNGMTVEEIHEKTGASSYTTERLIVQLIRNREISADAYVQAQYKDEIVRKASEENWDGKIRSIKESLPSDCSYLTIKAVLAANDL